MRTRATFIVAGVMLGTVYSLAVAQPPAPGAAQEWDENIRVEGLRKGKELGYNPIVFFAGKDQAIAILRRSARFTR